MSGRRAPDDRLHPVEERRPSPRGADDPAGVAAAVLAGGGAVAFAVGLLAGAPAVVYGTALAVGLGALAVGVRRYFAFTYPRVEAVEPRAGLTEDDATDEPLSDVPPARRRSVARRVVLAAAGVLGASFLAPVASLGPQAGDKLRRTAWRAGRLLVDADGQPLRPGNVVAGSAITAWPQHAVGAERSAVLVVRLSGRSPQAPTNLDWVVDRTLVAYSKICTHAGCPVGLFRERDNALFCPCHQTTFDAVRAAAPTFGPAARALPQLPMTVDADGFLVALGDFTEQVGPSFGWLPR